MKAKELVYGRFVEDGLIVFRAQSNRQPGTTREDNLFNEGQTTTLVIVRGGADIMIVASVIYRFWIFRHEFGVNAMIELLLENYLTSRPFKDVPKTFLCFFMMLEPGIFRQYLKYIAAQVYIPIVLPSMKFGRKASELSPEFPWSKESELEEFTLARNALVSVQILLETIAGVLEVPITEGLCSHRHTKTGLGYMRINSVD
ncbi:hypothetical protein RF11_11712 [Thelohanellus kitauei]|uniref:Uncharacterized protein n=1 Tax=Thelohanellus kitauei TaxID=669202 RepID=A0A0C2N8X1_THEKT|nr:hypothetical protein RF11_11712 [Thelohanellus kitauei]